MTTLVPGDTNRPSFAASQFVNLTHPCDSVRPIVDAVRRAVSRKHTVAIHDVRLVAAGVIPRTTSGKLARRACRAEYLGGTLSTR